MSLDTPEQYGLSYVMAHFSNLNIADHYMRESEIFDQLLKFVEKILSGMNAQHYLNTQKIAQSIFHDMKENQLIVEKKGGVAGVYYKFDEKLKAPFRGKFIKQDPIYRLSKEIGGRFYIDSFSALERAAAEGINIDAKQSGESQAEQIESDDPIDSPVPTDFFNDEVRRQNLVTSVVMVRKQVDEGNLGNEERATALGYLDAISLLAELPKPPSDLIWKLVERASNLVGIASFFLSLYALFQVGAP